MIFTPRERKYKYKKQQEKKARKEQKTKQEKNTHNISFLPFNFFGNFKFKLEKN